MLWMNLTFLFALFNLKSKENEGNIITFIQFFTFGVLQTIMYYKFQHLYWVFITTYVLGVVIIVFTSFYLVYKCVNKEHYELRYYLFTRAILSYVLIGAVLWIYEMNNCDVLLPYFISFYGMSFHILWHIGAAYGTYLQILLCIVCRAQALGHSVQLYWLLNIIPIIKSSSNINSINKKKL